MSRSYHITKKQAAQRAKEGDMSAVANYIEKSNLKAEHKRFRKVYRTIRPDAKSQTARLRNSVSQSLIKEISKKNREEIEKIGS
jgi:hypothetical protein